MVGLFVNNLIFLGACPSSAALTTMLRSLVAALNIT